MRPLLLPLVVASLAFAADLPAVPPPGDPIDAAARQQVQWLEATLDAGDAEKNRRQFPEGELFTWEFWSLALLNIAERSQQPADVARAAKEARRSLAEIDRVLAHPPFARMQGWALRGGICWFAGQHLIRMRLVALPGVNVTAAELERLHADEAILVKAYAESKTGVLPAHPGQHWPVDGLFALEAMRLHDARFGTSHFTPAWAKYVRTVDAAMDSKLGLPASYVAANGEVLDPPRGCALSWTLSVLPRLDPARAKAQWLAFRKSYFGCESLPCLVREWPPGVNRKADVDSGPIVSGYGMAATGFALAAARANGDLETARRLERTGELLGAPELGPFGRRYAGGVEPMFDVLALYVRTVPVGP